MSRARVSLRQGTFIFAQKRWGEVIIAVDSRARMSKAVEGDPGSVVDKLYVHPRLPLVITMAGVMELATKPTDDRTQVAEFESVLPLIAEAMRDVRYERHLDIEQISKNLIRLFQPRMEATLTYAETEEELGLHITLIIGLFGKGGLKLKRLGFGRESFVSDMGWFFLGSPALDDYRNTREPIAAGRFTINDSAESVAETMVDEIGLAIEAEAAIREPHLRSCGWPVRVAIIGRNGIKRATFMGRDDRPGWQ